MKRSVQSVAEQRNYRVVDVNAAKQIALVWLQKAQLENVVGFGLPEVDDRYHIWRVPLLNKATRERLGEVVIDARSSLILQNKSTTPENLEARLLGRTEETCKTSKTPRSTAYTLSTMRNTIALGDSEEILQDLPAECVDLIFTSPPYYNARPEYTDYITYEEYLLKLRKIIYNVHRVLAEGRFFVINISPVLIRRANRYDKRHPAIFPLELAEKVISYYSFKGDVVLDPFAGIGTVGAAATELGRRFVLIEQEAQYVSVIRDEAKKWLHEEAKSILMLKPVLT